MPTNRESLLTAFPSLSIASLPVSLHSSIFWIYVVAALDSVHPPTSPLLGVVVASISFV